MSADSPVRATTTAGGDSSRKTAAVSGYTAPHVAPRMTSRAASRRPTRRRLPAGEEMFVQGAYRRCVPVRAHAFPEIGAVPEDAG